ncbi:MAG: nucleotidyltransferase family protein [Pseudomonadota bacterium]
MSKAQAMVFAAGRGTRMGALTETVPKPLLSLGQETLLDYTLAEVRRAGFQRVVVNHSYLGAQIVAHLSHRPGITLSAEPEPLETGGGLKAALPHLSAGPILTTNSDTVFAEGPSPISPLVRSWRPGMGALLLVSPIERAQEYVGKGDFDMALGQQLTFRGDAPFAPFVFTGIQIIDPAWVKAHEGRVWSLREVWRKMAAERALYGFIHDADWVDTGTPAGLEAARALRSRSL